MTGLFDVAGGRVARAGWAVADADGHIITASPGFTLLVGANEASALAGRWLADLAAPHAISLLLDAHRAASHGEAWQGVIPLAAGGRAFEVLADVSAAQGARDRVVLWEVAEPAVLAAPAPSTPAPAPPEVTRLRAEVATLAAASALRDPSAAARALLQEVRRVIPYDWAVVLRFGGDRVEVAANYPAAIAGAETGSVWTPVDPSERAALFAEAPSLMHDLPETAGRSPLARLPAFGLHSALRVPLFRPEGIVGAVSLYAYARGAFRTEDGIVLERYVRPLAAVLTPLESIAPLPRPVEAAAPSLPRDEAPERSVSGVRPQGEERGPHPVPALPAPRRPVRGAAAALAQLARTMRDLLRP